MQHGHALDSREPHDKNSDDFLFPNIGATNASYGQNPSRDSGEVHPGPLAKAIQSFIT